MQQVDLAAELRKDQRFLEGRVACARHHDVGTLVHRAVAVSAARHAPVLEFRFPRHAEFPKFRAGGNDHGRGIVAALVGRHDQAPACGVDAGHAFGQHLDTGLAGLEHQVGREIRPGAFDGAVEFVDVDHEPAKHLLLDAGDAGAQLSGLFGCGQAGDALAEREDDGLYDVKAGAKAARNLFAYSILYLFLLFAALLGEHLTGQAPLGVPAFLTGLL